MNDIPETYVFESPDGGHTVYRRPFGKDQPRELVSISAELQEKKQLDTLWMKWLPILRDSKDDPVLKEMLEKVMIYHTIKNSP